MNGLERLINVLGKDRVRLGEPMKNHTTFRIGGPAELFFETADSGDLQRAVLACKELDVPYFILGMGANLLVSAQGIRGLVIKTSNNGMEIVGRMPDSTGEEGQGLPAIGQGGETEHYRPFETDKYLKFDDLDFTEPVPDTKVLVGAGASLPVLISWTLDQGLTGLQSFAGIPASVGGAVYNNIHGGTKLFDQFVDQVTVLNKEGFIRQVCHDEMGFGYDDSCLQKTHEMVLEVTLRLSHGDVGRAKWAREQWLRRKLIIQPQTNCPGCVFKNLSVEEAKRIGSPTVGAGWVLDVGLGLKGMRIGGISVSDKHANFFVNDGTGRAVDVLDLIRVCKEKAKEKYSLDLKEEIQIVGV